ncbi:MAG: hydantoinase B/oxoprolinase family protein [Polyangiaceae bacterium]
MSPSAAARWQFWIDRGGTFTDCLGVEPKTGRVRVHKLLSSDAAPLEGIRALLGLRPEEPLPDCDVRLGTTIATNALLERRGAPAGLLVTQGFRDLLLIGSQARPELFELDIRKPAPVYAAVGEAEERLDAKGGVLTALDETSVKRLLEGWLDAGIRSVAVCLLHATQNPTHECLIGALATRLGFEWIALSHQVKHESGYLARCDTTLLDATLSPLCRAHLERLRAGLSAASTLRVMQSSGDLVPPERFRGPSAVLSGPAGGVVALAHVAEHSALGPCLGFDMGGTSTDVARYASEMEADHESTVGGVCIRAPILRIETVAAGGGSICRRDGSRYVVGPESAGAIPGPLCYGRAEAEALTLTDINLALGRLVADRFPFALDAERVDRALDALARQDGSTPEAVAEGFFHVANATMAEALRRASALRGHDPRGHCLVVFGGAGGQHACALARRLGLSRVAFHPWGGVLSAYGMGLAKTAAHGELDAHARVVSDASHQEWNRALDGLEASLRQELAGEAEGAEIHIERSIDLRYCDTDPTLTLPFAAAGELRNAFHSLHASRFGFARSSLDIEAVTLRLRATVNDAREVAPPLEATAAAPEPRRLTRLYSGGVWQDVPLYDRERLGVGTVLRGPCVILERTATLVIDPGFEVVARDDGLLVAEDVSRDLVLPELSQRTQPRDPVLLEIFGNAFMSIAEQMGESLRRTARSTNIAQRRDYSCAVFDAAGHLVANAPHIPVHLGAMGETVRAVRRARPQMKPGSAFVSNDPGEGGSHLPDITVVTPVFSGEGRLRFFVASRGHHADVGGVTPGSMPAESTRLEEEGVVFRAVAAVVDGEFQDAALRAVLESGPFPARDPDTNIADLQAQVAANHHGARLLAELDARYGTNTVERYMNHVRADAAERVRAALAACSFETSSYRDCMDDGSAICARLSVQGGRLIIDCTGTAPAHPGNLNAPRAVTVAAVIYFLRCLVAERIPLNAGCLDPVELRIPRGSMLDPPAGSAVAAGNVETSQRIVDVLLAAAGLCAASQGTMNNLTLGNAKFQYYETIAGGAGAGPGYAGASGVHTHMTNTRITDPEVLERRYPMRLVAFALRPGSGGDGAFRGGLGIRREFELLEPMHGSLIADRRRHPPFGLEGGSPGATGSADLDGAPLDGTFEASAGSRLCILTPGGGGYGAALPLGTDDQ